MSSPNPYHNYRPQQQRNPAAGMTVPAARHVGNASQRQSSPFSSSFRGASSLRPNPYQYSKDSPHTPRRDIPDFEKQKAFQVKLDKVIVQQNAESDVRCNDEVMFVLLIKWCLL